MVTSKHVGLSIGQSEELRARAINNVYAPYLTLLGFFY